MEKDAGGHERPKTAAEPNVHGMPNNTDDGDVTVAAMKAHEDSHKAVQ